MQTLIPVSVERRLLYLFNEVDRSQFLYYLSWLVDYVGANNDVVFQDIVRYIVVNIHPTNEILGSTIVQRWEVIQHIICGLDNQLTLSQVLFALFYDWFKYRVDPSYIMRVEPGLLLINNNKDPRMVDNHRITSFKDQNGSNFQI